MSGTGEVTATGAVGSALVTATAGGVSGQIVVVSVVPVEGAVLVSDADVVEGPTLLDSEQPLDVGSLYQVTLAVPPPAVGAYLLATGEAQVAGRVTTVNGSVATLELVPLDELFEELSIDQSIDLATAPLLDAAGADPTFAVRRLADGDWHVQGAIGAGLVPQAEFKAGPLTCKSDFNFSQLDVLNFAVTFTPALKVDVVVDAGHKKVVVHGSPKAVATFEPVVKGVLQESVGCDLTVGDIQIPLPGPIGAVVGAVVPFGVGFNIGGTVPLLQAGFHFDAELGADVSFGFDCDPACEGVAELTPHVTGHQRPILPGDLSGLRLEASLFGYLFVGLEAGLRKDSSGRIRLARGQTGLKLGAKLASEETQFQDDAYSSEYALDLVATIGAGTGAQAIFNLMNVELGRAKPPSDTGSTSVTYQAAYHEEYEETGPNYHSSYEEDEVLSGQLSLEVLSRSDSAIVFEVTGGSIQYSYVTSFVEVETNVMGSEPGCTYTERTEVTHDGAGGQVVPAGTPGVYRIDIADNGEYTLQMRPDLFFEVPAQDGFKTTGACGYENIDETTPGSDEVDPSFEITGIVDPGNPGVFSGGYVDGTPEGGTTYTWSLVLPPP